MADGTYQSILRAASIIGSAQIISVLLSVLRNKIISITLGPVGLGIIGLYTQIIQTAGMIGSVGLGSSGTQRIAELASNDDEDFIRQTKATLLISLIFLSVFTALIFFLLSDTVGGLVGINASSKIQLILLSTGVGVSVMIAYQTAILTGLRQIKALALINVTSALLGTIIAILAMFYLRNYAIMIIVLSIPTITLFVGIIFSMLKYKIDWRIAYDLISDLKPLLKLGVPLMLSSAMGMVGFIIVRLIITNQSGASALGYYQASWMIGVTYLGFILNSMVSDYFPRLSGSIESPELATEIVNKQTKLLLILASPIIYFTITFSPQIIKILYSEEFAPAAMILKWHIIGDILKCAAWPLSYVIVARKRGKLFFFLEFVAAFSMIIFTWSTIPYIGVEAAGLALIVMYSINLIMVHRCCRLEIGFTWDKGVFIYFATLFVTALILVFLTNLHHTYGLVFGGVLTTISTVWCVRSIWVLTGGFSLRRRV